MSPAEIRPATEADLPSVTEIYEHAVLYGTATFELMPPDLAEMTRRFKALLDGGFPYFVGVLEGRVVGYAYAGPYRPRPAYRFTVENSVYLRPAIHRRGIGLQLMLRLIAECEARGYRQMIAVIGDSANAGSIGVHTQNRLPDDRDSSQCRPQIRPLARHRDDAAHARRRRNDGAGG
ncbi:L-amino acid N-acyltransferase YncA [Bradyrhizobium sp. AZCC 2289]